MFLRLGIMPERFFEAKHLRHHEIFRICFPRSLDIYYIFIVCIHCIYALYVFTVLIVCTHGMHSLYASSVCFHCMYSMYVRNVCLHCMYSHVCVLCMYTMLRVSSRPTAAFPAKQFISYESTVACTFSNKYPILL